MERMDRGNVDGSHRLVRFGDTENWGLVESKTREQWAKHMSDLDPLVESRGPRYTGRILGSNGVNPVTKPYIQIYDLEVSNPVKWLAAFAKLIEDTKDSYNGGMVVYGTLMLVLQWVLTEMAQPHTGLPLVQIIWVN